MFVQLNDQQQPRTWPVSWDNVRALTPETAWPTSPTPAALHEAGFARLEASARPTAAWNEQVREQDPEKLKDGLYRQRWRKQRLTGKALTDALAALREQAINAIRAEAERRIDAGFMHNGSPFRCDTASLTRLQLLCEQATEAESRDDPVNVTFRTAAGITVTITSAAAAATLCRQAGEHTASILAVSNRLQGEVANMSGNALAAAVWTNASRWTA